MSSPNAHTLVGIVHSAWLPEFAERLLTRCRTDFAEDGIDVVTAQVPGVFTLAHGVRKLAATHPQCQGFVSLAVMIRGETSHADDLVRVALVSLADAMRDLYLPIVCELVIVDTEDQLKARCANDNNNRGAHAAHDLKMLLRLSK